MVDVSGSEGRDPIADFEIINRELANFNAELAAAPQIVAANKSDIATQEQLEAFQEYVTQKGLACFVISAATVQGTRELVNAVGKKLAELPPIKRFEAELPAPEETARKDSREFTVEIAEDGTYVVKAPWLESILRTADMDDYSSLQYFQRVLRTSGVFDKLEEMGVQEGDSVSIEGFEFDYIK